MTVDRKVEAAFAKEVSLNLRHATPNTHFFAQLSILARLEAAESASSPRPSTAPETQPTAEYVVHFPPKSLSSRPKTAVASARGTENQW